jgi:hypothetical protein
MSNHKWSYEDDVVAYYLARFGDRDLPGTLKEIGTILGMGEGSLRMRIGNFRALDGTGSLDHTAKLSRKVHEEHKLTPQAEHKARVLKILTIQR